MTWNQLMRSVRDIVTSSVRTIHRDTFVSKVRDILDSERVSGLPVVDDGGCPIGIITKTDLDRFEHIEGDPDNARAWEIASPKFVAIPISAPLQVAAQAILDQRVRRLIVTSGTTPVGVLTVSDIMLFVDREYAVTLHPL